MIIVSYKVELFLFENKNEKKNLKLIIKYNKLINNINIAYNYDYDYDYYFITSN